MTLACQNAPWLSCITDNVQAGIDTQTEKLYHANPGNAHEHQDWPQRQHQYSRVAGKRMMSWQMGHTNWTVGLLSLADAIPTCHHRVWRATTLMQHQYTNTMPEQLHNVYKTNLPIACLNSSNYMNARLAYQCRAWTASSMKQRWFTNTMPEQQLTHTQSTCSKSSNMHKATPIYQYRAWTATD